MENLDIEKLNTNKGLVSLLIREPLNFQRAMLCSLREKVEKIAGVYSNAKWVIQENKRVIVLFEGRDVAGKVELFVELQNELIRDISKWLCS